MATADDDTQAAAEMLIRRRMSTSAIQPNATLPPQPQTQAQRLAAILKGQPRP